MQVALHCAAKQNIYKFQHSFMQVTLHCAAKESVTVRQLLCHQQIQNIEASFVLTVTVIRIASIPCK